MGAADQTTHDLYFLNKRHFLWPTTLSPASAGERVSWVLYELIRTPSSGSLAFLEVPNKSLDHILILFFFYEFVVPDEGLGCRILDPEAFGDLHIIDLTSRRLAFWWRTFS